MKYSALNAKQKSILFYFIDAAQVAPEKVNHLVRITLTSKLNTSVEFSNIVEGFMDCNPTQVKQKCQEILDKIT